VSLSRADIAVTGDAVTFSPEIWERTFAGFHGAKVTSIASAAKVRQENVEAAMKVNPRAHFGIKEKILSYGESALYLIALGGAKTGEVPVEWVDIFFCKCHSCTL